MNNTQPKGSHFIGGDFVAGKGDVVDNIYPATGEIIARIAHATSEEVGAAVESALHGAAVWAATPAVERGRVLRKTAEILRVRNQELARLETLDTGKPIAETLVADPASGADCLEFFGGLADTLAGEHHDLGGDWLYTRREPLGVVAGLGAWNYPIQIACWKAAPALAAGNAMVFKPSELTPLTALALAEIFHEAGLPPGVFNVVQGGAPVGAGLAAHPGIAKISLTGSVGTGRAVMAAAADGLKQVALELGGKSPLIIFDDADLDDAVGGAMLGNFYSSGQICSNGTRVFVHRSVREAFLDKLLARTGALRLGDPLGNDTQIGPLISAAQQARVLDYIAVGKTEAELLAGGNAPVVPGFEGGFFVEPTIFAAPGDNCRIAAEEIFGPVMTVLEFDDERQVIARANDTDYGLASGVFTNNLARAHRVAGAMEAGMCWINSYNLTPVQMPFGGVKHSGIGRENGRAALAAHTRVKSVYVGMGAVDAPY